MKNKKKTRQFKGLTLDQRQKLRRQQFIDAGLKAFGESGFFSVTIRDICIQAKLTERYFYESFQNSEDLFTTIFSQSVVLLQNNVMQAIVDNQDQSLSVMVNAGLRGLFEMLYRDPGMARIVYIDSLALYRSNKHDKAMHQALLSFDQMIQMFLQQQFPFSQKSESQMALLASGLNGFVTQIVVRWVIAGFDASIDDLLAVCSSAYLAIIPTLEQEENVSLSI